MVEQKLPKLTTRVRFPSPAPSLEFQVSVFELFSDWHFAIRKTDQKLRHIFRPSEFRKVFETYGAATILKAEISFGLRNVIGKSVFDIINLLTDNLNKIFSTGCTWSPHAAVGECACVTLVVSVENFLNRVAAPRRWNSQSLRRYS